MESYRGTTFHRMDVRERPEGVLLTLVAKTPDGTSLDVTVIGANLDACKEEIRSIIDRYLDAGDRDELARQMRIGRELEELGQRSPELLELCLRAASQESLPLPDAARRCAGLLDDGHPAELVELQLSAEWGLGA